MNGDLERALRRYRVVDPPAALAARILEPERDRGPSHGWGALAAAALAAIWVGAHVAGREAIPDPIRERDVAAIVETLGGGEEARRYAEDVVPHREMTIATAFPLEGSW